MNTIQTRDVPKSGKGNIFIPEQYRDKIVVPDWLEYSREDIIECPKYHRVIYCGNYPGVQQRLVHLRDKNTDLMRRVNMTTQLAGMLFREASDIMPSKEIEITTGNDCKMKVRVPDFRAKLINNIRTGTELAFPMREDAFYTTFYSESGDPKTAFLGMKRPKNPPFHAEMQGYESCDKYNPGEISIIGDPILSTGGSVDTSVSRLKELGHPENTIYVLSIIATPQGIQMLNKKYPEITIVVAEIDHGVDVNGYVYPGLGDAGFLFYGIP